MKIFFSSALISLNEYFLMKTISMSTQIHACNFAKKYLLYISWSIWMSKLLWDKNYNCAKLCRIINDILRIFLIKVMPHKSKIYIINNTSGLTFDMYKYRYWCLNTDPVPVPPFKVLLSLPNRYSQIKHVLSFSSHKMSK